MKTALKEAQHEGKEGNVTSRKRAEKMETECKRLEKLNADLLTVVSTTQYRFGQTNDSRLRIDTKTNATNRRT